MSSGSNEQKTATSYLARVIATLRRRSPPLFWSGPQLFGISRFVVFPRLTV